MRYLSFWFFSISSIAAALAESSVEPRPSFSEAICNTPRSTNYLTYGFSPQNSTSALSHPGGVSVSSSAVTASASQDEHITTANVQHDAQPITITPIRRSTESSATPSESSPSLSSTEIAIATVDEDHDDLVFLSFEEWRKQNDDQLDLDFDVGKKAVDTLESPMEDDEIHVDVHAIIGQYNVTPPRTSPGEGASSTVKTQTPSTKASIEKAQPRSKDAGKTCKERYNFASVDVGAQIMKSNPEAKQSSAILTETRDYYMRNPCSAENKFVIVELSDSIYIDTIAIANYEFFSQKVRQFRVSVSARYPVKADKWIVLGTFEARHSRDIQAFLVENPLIEARYLRLEFLNYYGSESICPMSLLRVHGQTMLQEVMSWERAASGEEDDDDEPESVEIGTVLPSRATTTSSLDEPAILAQSAKLEVTKTTTPNTPNTYSSRQIASPSAASTPPKHVGEHSVHESRKAQVANNTSPWHKPIIDLSHVFSLQNASTCVPLSAPSIVITSADILKTVTVVVSTENVSTVHHARAQESMGSSPKGNNSVTVYSAVATDAPIADSITQNIQSQAPASPTTSVSSTDSVEAQVRHQETKSPKSDAPRINTRASRASSSQPAQPSTQESFFKTVTKRIQKLEANSTLSQRYFEMQSRSLRDAVKDALSKAEKRQLSRITTFLEGMNKTVMAELRKFGQENEQIQSWQLAALQLFESHSENSKLETAALRDEVQSLKWMVMILFVISVLCLGLMLLFSRSGNSIDMPILQSMLVNSKRSRSMIGFGSPGDNLQLRRNGSYRDSLRWDDANYEGIRSDESDALLSRSREVSPSFSLSEYSRRENEYLSNSRPQSFDGSNVSALTPRHTDSDKIESGSPSDNVHESFQEQEPRHSVESPPHATPIGQGTPDHSIHNASHERVHVTTPRMGELSAKKRRKLAAKIALQEARKALPSPPPEIGGHDRDQTIARKPLPALPRG